MGWIDPRYEENQRRRWLRPDWQRWARHDAHRFAPPSVQTKSFAARRIEQRQAAEAEAALAAEQSALRESLAQLQCAVADLKYEFAWRRLCRKYGYNPDQPRRPRGDPEGPGEWVRVASSDGAMVTKLAAMRRGGHHYVARQVYKSRRLPEDTRKVFEEATTGKLEDKRTNVFNSSHRAYNKAVNEQFDQYLTRSKISEEQMTPDHARQFLKEIVT
jgi:hypothetical protein